MALNSSDKNKQEKGEKVVSAGFIVYRKTNDGPRFLLLYRGRGAWDMPRGRMMEGERSLGTAFREVKEETGLGRSDLRMKSDFRRVYEKFPYFSKEGKRGFKIVIFYLAETDKSKVVLSEEHEGYAWFTLNEARQHIKKYKARQELLKKAFDFIKT